MGPISVSKPARNADGSYGVKVNFHVADHPIIVELRASKALGAQLQSLVGDKVSFGAQNPYAEFWKYTDTPIAAINEIAQSPAVAQMVRSVPYSAGAVRDMNETLAAHHAIKGGRRDILQRILHGVRAGIAKAHEALMKLRTVARAEQMRDMAAKNYPAAIQQFRKLSQGLSAGDPRAVEAYMVLDGLHRLSSGQPLAQPAPIHVQFDWMGTETPGELAQKIANAVRFGATPGRWMPAQMKGVHHARLRAHLAHVNGKEAAAKRAQQHRAWWGVGRPAWHVGGDHSPTALGGPLYRSMGQSFAGSCIGGACSR